jgi:hypothetical protein
VNHGWDHYLPNTDGLPTRMGGGMLRHVEYGKLDPEYRGRTYPPEKYPIKNPSSFASYDLKEKHSAALSWTTDYQHGKMKGFAYCIHSIAASRCADKL